LFDYDVQRTTLIAEGWAPVRRLADINEAIARAHDRSRALVAPVLNVVETRDTPPTYFQTNKFTKAFQDIVDSYGVASYQEVNPAPLTIITFPFLFGVMFGDVGHGFLMGLFALFLVLREKQLGRTRLNEMIKTCYDGRYVLLLMSFFAIYMGFLYNECLAVPLDFFGVKTFQYYDCVRQPADYLQPYPFGVSPAWLPAVNSLNFYNSLKMKLSVLIGVIQMTVGIILSAFNGIYFRHRWQNRYDFWFEFLPQIVFMLAIFGYMDFLILLKWSTNYMNVDPHFEAPKLLNLLIAMFQSPMKLDPAYELYSGQHAVQNVLVVLAVVSVPTMLFLKPFLLRRDWRRMNPNWREIEAARKAAENGPTTQALPAPGGAVTHEAGEGDSGDAHEHLGGGKKYRRKGAKYQKLQSASGVMVVDDDSDDDDADADQDFYSSTSETAHDAQHVVVVDHHADDEFDFGEILVHQMIHTIEFVLGAVSNTASYLRLWALSLAHSELSAVFFDKVAVLALNEDNAFAIFVGFGAWAGLTVAVLLLMESLSAFLHALRLHWVESQNKFYHGTGYLYVPVSHEAALKTDEDD
jgi:V-type H+-transporting ATPase subunit a